MKKIKNTLLGALLLLPGLTLAHGEEIVVTTFLIEFIRLIIFIVLLVVLNLTRAGKFIWILTYLLGLAIAYAIIWQMPYRDNKSVIDLTIIVVPVIVIGLSYFVIRIRFQRF